MMFELCDVKSARALLPYNNRSILEVTQMGNTHGETDILPSNEQNKDSFLMSKLSRSTQDNCYNSFPLSIYSLDCSFSLSTYLERQRQFPKYRLSSSSQFFHLLICQSLFGRSYLLNRLSHNGSYSLHSMMFFHLLFSFSEFTQLGLCAFLIWLNTPYFVTYLYSQSLQ